MEHVFTDANFDAEVLKAEVPVLVDFWAPWCGPCRVQGPIVEELAGATDAAKGKVGKLNVDENGQTAMTYGVMSIPTIIVFKGGKEVDRFVGVQQMEDLKAALGKHS
jgi:thioredoxin 1